MTAQPGTGGSDDPQRDPVLTRGTRDDMVRRSGLAGALTAMVTWFPAAVVVALLYRFPIPFAGYARSVGHLPDVLWAALVYGLAGGFVVLGAAGGLGGWWAARRAARRGGRPGGAVYILAALVSLLAALALAVGVGALGLQ